MGNILILFGYMYICILRSISGAQKSCESNFMNISRICVSGHTSGDLVMLDFSPFESARAPSCGCTIYIGAGNRLEFNYVLSPGYYGCGSAITITHQTMSTIRCLQGAESVTVAPGDSVMVQIFRERETFNSKYCYLLRAYQLSGQDRIPGSMIVVCSQPPLSSTTTQIATKATSTTAHHRHTTSDVITSPTESLISTDINNRFTTSRSSGVVNITSTVLVTTLEVEVTTVSNTTGRTGTREIQHAENTDLAHFPWEIITPLSIIIFIVIVVIIVIFKIRRRRYLKSTYKPAETRTTSWAFNQPSLNASSPKTSTSLKTTIEKTDSGVYSTLGDNDKRSTESVHKATEKYYKEVNIDQAIVDSEAKKKREQEEMGVNNAGFIDDNIPMEDSPRVKRSHESSESDLANFISTMYAEDSKNQNYFQEYNERNISQDQTSENYFMDPNVSNYEQSEHALHVAEEQEVLPPLPIDTGYVIIDVLAKI